MQHIADIMNGNLFLVLSRNPLTFGGKKIESVEYTNHKNYFLPAPWDQGYCTLVTREVYLSAAESISDTVLVDSDNDILRIWTLLKCKNSQFVARKTSRTIYPQDLYKLTPTTNNYVVFGHVVRNLLGMSRGSAKDSNEKTSDSDNKTYILCNAKSDLPEEFTKKLPNDVVILTTKNTKNIKKIKILEAATGMQVTRLMTDPANHFYYRGIRLLTPMLELRRYLNMSPGIDSYATASYYVARIYNRAKIIPIPSFPYVGMHRDTFREKLNERLENEYCLKMTPQVKKILKEAKKVPAEQYHRVLGTIEALKL